MTTPPALNTSEESDSERETFTVVCRVDKLLVDVSHPARVVDVAERAHQSTRLASRLLNFHLRKCLERNIALPRFGHEHWLYKAWNAVTRASRQSEKRQDDAELIATRDEFMPDLVPVDSTRMADVLQSEARRWAATARTNIYQHFAKRVSKFVRTFYQLPRDQFNALTKPQRSARKLALAKVAYDLCSPPTNGLKSAPEYHRFVSNTRQTWRLHDFPWDGKPLKYHQKANSTSTASKCIAHLLLPAMYHMLHRRKLDGHKGFALLPLRTSLVPRHTHFGSEAQRAVLGVGKSELRKAKDREYQAAKRRKQAEPPTAPMLVEEAPAPAPGAFDNAVYQEMFPEGPTEEGLEEEEAGSTSAATQSPPSEGGKRKRQVRSKAVVAEERRNDLAKLFDLKAAGVHVSKNARFECTFTSDGYTAHLHFSRPKPKAPPEGDKSLPRRGIWHVEELAERLERGGATKEEYEARCEEINEITSPAEKLDKLCICCDGHFQSPFRGFVCVGCDPGKNEPAVMVDSLTGRKLRMTASGRRHATQPAVWKRTNRTRKQSYKQGGVDRLARDAKREENAIAYRKQYVDKPAHIGQLESEMGQLSCSTSSSLMGFRTYVDVLKAREPTLVPHYKQGFHRKLRFKAHIERQRFESRFIRDIKRTFDPEKTGKTIVLLWGSWGKIAGRPGTVGNRGHPPTIGVGLARRIAKEDGIVVAWTPEHYTTKTCFKCGGECGRAHKAEERRSKEAGFRHHVKEIRGLKQCTDCKIHVNRDLNAAKNIAVNGIMLLTGHNPIRQNTGDSLELTQFENEMHGASPE